MSELHTGDIWVGRKKMRRILLVFHLQGQPDDRRPEGRDRVRYCRGGDHHRECYVETFRQWIISAGAKLDRSGKK